MNIFDDLEKNATRLSELSQAGELTEEEAYETLINSLKEDLEPIKHLVPNLWNRINKVKRESS